MPPTSAQPSPSDKHRVVVVGAGIVGTVSALYLRRDGHEVTLIDRDDPGQGCSFGNAGLLARSSFAPIAGPDTLWNAPKWLLDPEGPLSIRWRYLPKLLPWLIRFVLAGLKNNVKTDAAALHVLTDPCVDLYRKLADEAGRPDLVKEGDYLQVYRHKAEFEKARGDFELRREFGMRIDEIGGDEIRNLEPGLSPDYEYAYHVHDHGFTVNPEGLVQAIADMFVSEGGKIVKADVVDIAGEGRGPHNVVTSNGSFECDRMVIAAGAFSHRLAAKLGINVPLETERGYHITCENPENNLTRPVMEGDCKFLTTPMAMGLRFAGTVELGGVDAPMNERRIRMLERQAKRMVPGLVTETATSWMGFRPTFPDSLPIIGPAPRHPKVVFAFGHQHLGLTCAPKTGQLVADLVSGRAPNVDIMPYRAERFG